MRRFCFAQLRIVSSHVKAVAVIAGRASATKKLSVNYYVSSSLGIHLHTHATYALRKQAVFWEREGRRIVYARELSDNSG